MAKTFTKWIEREGRKGIEGKKDMGFVRFVEFFEENRLREVEISLQSMERRFGQHAEEEAGEGERIGE